MGEIHQDTPRMDDQTEHTTGLADIIVERLHQWHNAGPGAQFTLASRGRGTTSRLSWRASTTRRMSRPRMDLRPTELLHMARLQKNRTTVDHIAHH